MQESFVSFVRRPLVGSRRVPPMVAGFGREEFARAPADNRPAATVVSQKVATFAVGSDEVYSSFCASIPAVLSPAGRSDALRFKDITRILASRRRRHRVIRREITRGSVSARSLPSELLPREGTMFRALPSASLGSRIAVSSWRPPAFARLKRPELRRLRAIARRSSGKNSSTPTTCKKAYQRLRRDVFHCELQIVRAVSCRDILNDKRIKGPSRRGFTNKKMGANARYFVLKGR